MRVPKHGEIGWYDGGVWARVWEGKFCELYMHASVEGLLLVGCGCRSHRNRHHIAEAQVAGSNIVSGASSCEGRLTFASLNASHP